MELCVEPDNDIEHTYVVHLRLQLFRLHSSYLKHLSTTGSWSNRVISQAYLRRMCSDIMYVLESRIVDTLPYQLEVLTT